MPRRPKIILITGATTGIGRDTALWLAREGHRVFATGRKAGPLEKLKQEAAGTSLEALILDVCDPVSIAAAREEVDRRTQGHGLDVLVNNAGFGLVAPMELISPQDVRALFDTNVFGLLNTTQAFLPRMRERGAGLIINLSSIAGRLTMPFMGTYCATKYAVEALSDALRMEGRPCGVRVCLVEPGTLRTQFDTTATSVEAKYFPPDSPYARAIQTYQRTFARVYRASPGPECVARLISRIVSSRRPRARYLVPRYNALLIFATRLSARWIVDAISCRLSGLTRKNFPPAGRG